MLMDMPHQNPNSILEQWQCELAHELIRIIIPINLMIDLKLLVLQLSHKLKPSGHSSLWNNHITNINLVLLVLRAMSSSLTVVNLAHRLSLYCFLSFGLKSNKPGPNWALFYCNFLMQRHAIGKMVGLKNHCANCCNNGPRPQNCCVLLLASWLAAMAPSCNINRDVKSSNPIAEFEG